MKRLLGYLLAVLLAGPAFAQDQSDADRGFLTNLIEEQLSGAGRAVRIVGFEGALSSRATFDEMTIADGEGVWLIVRDAALQWNRSALLSGRVEVGELRAEEIEVLRVPVVEEGGLPEAEAAPFRLPDLPVSIEIGVIEAGSVTLGAPLLGEEIGISLSGQVGLAGGEGQATLSVRRIDGTEGALELAGSFANATEFLRIDLQLQEPEGGIAARLLTLPGQPSVDLSITGEGPLSDFAGEISLATDGEERLSGGLTLSRTEVEGGPSIETFALDVGGDVTPLFLPQYREFFGTDVALVAGGRFVEGQGAQITEFRIDAASIELDGTAEIAEDGLPEAFRVTGRIAAPDGEPVRLPTGELPVLVDEAQLDFSFDADRGEDWSGSAQVTGLEVGPDRFGQAVLRAQGRIAREDGTNSAEGRLTFEATQIELQNAAQAEAVGDRLDAAAEIRWRAGDPITLTNVVIETATARAGLEGTIGAFADGLPFDARGSANIPDLAILTSLAGRPLGGRLVMGFNGGINLLDGQFDFRIGGVGRGLSAGLEILDRAIGGEARIVVDAKRDETGLTLREALLTTRTARLEASGLLRTGQTDVSATARLDDVGQVLPGIDGPAAIRARLTGSEPGRYAATATGEGPGGAVVSFDGSLIETEGGDITADGALTLRAADISPYGPAADLKLGGGIETTVKGSAAFEEDHFDVSIDLNGDGLRTGIPTVDRLMGATQTLDAAAVRDGDRTEITRFDLATGEVTANVTGALGRREGLVEGRAVLRNLAVFAPDFPGALELAGELTRNADSTWGLDLRAGGPGGTTATVSGSVSETGERMNLNLNGEAPLGLANASIAPRAVRGRAAFDLAVNGPPELSSVSGTIRTSGARLVAPTYGVSVDGIGGQVILGGQSAQIQMQGNVSGGGTASVSGNVGLTGGNAAQLRVRLADAFFTDRSAFETTVSGEVSITGPMAGGALIGGVLTLGETNVRIAETGLGAGGDLPGMIHLREPRPVYLTRLRAGLIGDGSGGTGGGSRPYNLDLLIDAPGRIFIRGRGLDAELGGSIRLRGTTNDVIPQGEFDLIRGRLDLLGRRLALDEGYARLEGSFDAFIRLVATTEADDITARIVIEGLASSPEFRFESSPELPQDEILARLFFGKSIEELSAFQALRLASAVATLTGRGGVGVVDKLRQNFGLDDFDIAQDSDGNLAVEAGKYISENVYTEVTVGSDGKTDISINLDVSDSVTLRGRVGSDGETGIGVFYEKDY